MGKDNLSSLVRHLKEAGLVALEAVYSTYSAGEERQMRQLAARYGLLISGGSDFHGKSKPGLELGTGYGKLFIPEDILLSNRSPEKAQALAEKLGAIPADNETITRDCDVIFLGVKPQTMAQMLLPLQPILAGRRTPFVLVSMAAGVTIEALQDMAGGRYPVVRIMPCLLYTSPSPRDA